MRQLRPEITCLHCWGRFKPEDALWVSEHRDLLGDPFLGEDAQLRFLPNRFDINGNAIDAKGHVCRDLACPKCHLSVPRSLLETEPLFVSILGTPSCGKSYYLGALATALRRDLPSRFKLGFTDADTVSNQLLYRYEEHLFLSHQAEEQVSLADLIPKTQLHGDLYHTVRHGQQTVTYPRAFSFLLAPLETHPNRPHMGTLQRVVSLYDNAGEHFLPGQDSVAAPGTRHLAESSFLLFLFDPTQDPRWHAAMRKANPDQQVPRTQHAGRQEGVLREAAGRIRKLLGLPDGVKYARPLLVLLSKADVWQHMLPDEGQFPALTQVHNGTGVVDMTRVQALSGKMRQIVSDHIPELVFAAESFCDQVFYLPVSALGTPPEFRENGQAFIRPMDIRPKGVAEPFLLGLSLSTKGLVARAVVKTPGMAATSP